MPCTSHTFRLTRRRSSVDVHTGPMEGLTVRVTCCCISLPKQMVGNIVEVASQCACCSAAFMSSPCHIELVLTEKNSDVKTEAVSIYHSDVWQLQLQHCIELCCT